MSETKKTVTKKTTVKKNTTNKKKPVGKKKTTTIKVKEIENVKTVSARIDALEVKDNDEVLTDIFKTQTINIIKEEAEKIDKVEREKEEKHSNKKNALILLGIVAAIILILVLFPHTVIWNVIVLLIILSLLIFVHEFGHFIMGKKFGVHIYEFAIGMGPKVCSFRRKNDETIYSVHALPLGGYNSMAGEDGIDGEMKLAKNKYLCNKPWWQQLIVLVMGVVMNFITAILLLIAMGFMIGAKDISNEIGSVVKDSPAEIIGIRAGDKVLEFNGHKVSNWDQMNVYSAYKSTSKTRKYKIEHADGKTETYELTPVDFAIVKDKTKKKELTIRIKDDYTLDDIAIEYNVSKDDIRVVELVGINESQEKSFKFMDVIKYAFKKFAVLFTTIWMILGALITGKIGLAALSGPVGMYSVVGTAAKYGAANLVYLTAYLSINLGVVNIFPFPAFDGGRVVFVLIEAITKKKIPPKVEGIVNTVGFALLMLLMLIVTGHDIFNLFK